MRYKIKVTRMKDGAMVGAVDDPVILEAVAEDMGWLYKIRDMFADQRNVRIAYYEWQRRDIPHARVPTFYADWFLIHAVNR